MKMNRRPHLHPHLLTRLLPLLRRRFAGEDGIAIVLALGTMVVLGLTTSGALMYSAQNQGSAARSKAAAAVLSVAEAGINNAMAVLSNPTNDPTNAALLPTRTDVYDAGSVTWWGTYDAPTSTWTLTATGEIRNPTGVTAAPVRRRVSALVSVVAGTAPLSPLQNPSWNYTVATRTGNPCDETLSSSVVAGVPLFTVGNLCLGSLSKVTAGPLEVRGSLTVAADATIGAVGTPIPRADIFGGCSGHVCSAADRVFATTITQTAPALTAPVADWDYWYANASPGPKHPCEQASGTYPTFDNNALRDKSVATVYSLTPVASYTCRVGPVGNPTGELSWNASSKVLTIKGTIFIDGQAKIDNGQVDTYQGQGVIYLSGAFSVANGSKMCAVVSGTDCDFTLGAWDPAQKLLTVASNGTGGIGVLAGNSIQIGCLDRFQGPLYGTNAFQITGGAVGAKHQGQVVASTIILASGAELKPYSALTIVPRGLPGQSPTSTTVNPPRDFTG
jgi:Tfp pilus assembly protein PilX